jgi:uncharacterized protein (TIGR02611 family)
MHPLLRWARRIGIAIAGGSVVIAGVILLPLPGPGALVIAAGLGILSLEFEAPRRWLSQGRSILRYWVGRARFTWRHRGKPRRSGLGGPPRRRL